MRSRISAPQIFSCLRDRAGEIQTNTTTKSMKSKIASLKFSSVTELSNAEQKQVKGGGPNSPCCPTSPYYNVQSCEAYKRQCGYCDPNC
jgi:hypothetical protein